MKNRSRGKGKRVRTVQPLNDLTGSQWLYFTNTVWETSVPLDPTHGLRKAHGAMKPPQAMAELVRFFTRKGGRVLDPFAGVGGIILGADLERREAIGVEVDRKWVDIFQEIKKNFAIFDGTFVARCSAPDGSRPIEAAMVCASCLTFMEEQEWASFDAIITDPPYGVRHGARVFRSETNFSMVSGNPQDFGNAPDFESYFRHMAAFGALARRLLRPRRYLVMLVGDRYVDGEYLPLGVRVAEVLRREGFELKGIKIWWNKSSLRPLKPYAVGTCFVPNITHQNVLILRRR